MIVTPQGLNVFPEDVERALLAQPGVKEAGVVGLPCQRRRADSCRARPRARRGCRSDRARRNADARRSPARLEHVDLAGPRLPRTEGTQKLKRRELQRWAAGETRARRPRRSAAITGRGRRRPLRRRPRLKPETTLDELGLSSLDRVELMMALEDAFQITLDEACLAKPERFDDLRGAGRRGSHDDRCPRLAGRAGLWRAAPAASRERATASRTSRFGSRPGTAGRSHGSCGASACPPGSCRSPACFSQLKVEGLEHLRGLHGPVIFASNHQSHMDTPTILIALPARWRYRVAPAMSREFFYAHFHRRAVGLEDLGHQQPELLRRLHVLQRVSAVARRERHAPDAALHRRRDAGRLLDPIFPEGERHDEGEMAPFRPGVGMIAARLDLPVIPGPARRARQGAPQDDEMAEAGPGARRVRRASDLDGEDYPALARQVEDAVRRL